MTALPAPRTIRWGSLPLSVEFYGDWKEVRSRLPYFDRVSPEKLGFGANPHFDLVVRRPDVRSPNLVPVGMVSKTYRVVQHHEIIEKLYDFAAELPNAEPGELEVSMTENGERALFRIDLGKAWAFGPDGKEVGLQIVCRNSVDGSSAVRLHLGWFRFVCSNGMLIGVTLGKTRIAHTENADLNRAISLLQSQIEFAKREQDQLAGWGGFRVSLPKIQQWSDECVREKWNTLSAARIWHICSSGRDAKFLPPFIKADPSQRKVELLDAVPGAPKVAETLYDVAQALSWLASHRTDMNDVQTHQRDIGMLMEALKQRN